MNVGPYRVDERIGALKHLHSDGGQDVAIDRFRREQVTDRLEHTSCKIRTMVGVSLSSNRLRDLRPRWFASYSRSFRELRSYGL